MSARVEEILAGGPPSQAMMRGTIAGLYGTLPVRGDPVDLVEMMMVLRLLYRVTRADVPLARLFEGQVDALQIIARYAAPAIAAQALAAADDGAAFGVWNAAIPDEPLRIEGGRLWGGKSFASGAGILTHALAGADTEEGNRLVLIDLVASQPQIDRDWWRVVGMQRSQTHVVRWDGADADSFVFVGGVGDYAREPFFSGGALRFVACHAGGVAALFDHVRDHLRDTGRAADPHQAGRLAELYVLAQSAADWVRSAGSAISASTFVDQVAAARIAVAACGEQALSIAQQAVGVSAMFVEHPLSAVLTDLMVYLRQPAPDAQRMRVGRAAADGGLVPQL